MTWYRQGTVALTAGSNEVIGAGTAWLGLVLAGEGVDAPDGRIYEIAEVVNNTRIILAGNYLGATANAAAYQIIPNASMTKELTIRVNALIGGFDGVPGVVGQHSQQIGDLQLGAADLTTQIGELKTKKADLTAVAHAQALAATFAAIPAMNVGAMILVTSPHDRFMRWNGTKYVRANWDRPGRIFYTPHNNASEPGALPVRADVSYAKANYPDLCEALGITGTGNFTLLELRGEFLRVLDNGRGVDAGRTHGSVQGSAVQAHGHNIKISPTSASGTSNFGIDGGGGSMFSSESFGGTETRPRNLALPAWVSY